MNRLIPTVLLCSVSYLAGYATNSQNAVAAQGGGAQNFPPVVEGKGMHWSVDNLARAHNGSPLSLPRTPIYRMNINRRLHHDKPQPSDQLKIMSLWDDAEWHANLTQVYFLIGGSGTIVLGGDVADHTERSAGERRGQPVKGGTAYKVKTGDVLLIPPTTWHWSQPDPGGMSYINLTIATRTTPP
jgi:mannose-6-phosphate isomerase-like protein (cupin superfamily)